MLLLPCWTTAKISDVAWQPLNEIILDEHRSNNSPRADFMEKFHRQEEVSEQSITNAETKVFLVELSKKQTSMMGMGSSLKVFFYYYS